MFLRWRPNTSPDLSVFALGKRQVLKRAYSMHACNCDFNDAKLLSEYSQYEVSNKAFRCSEVKEFFIWNFSLLTSSCSFLSTKNKRNPYITKAS